MIGFDLSEILGGEPVTDSVYHVKAKLYPGRILEKVVAADVTEAMAKARNLLGDVPGLFVSGPHEILEAVESPVSEFAESVKRDMLAPDAKPEVK